LGSIDLNALNASMLVKFDMPPNSETSLTTADVNGDGRRDLLFGTKVAQLYPPQVIPLAYVVYGRNASFQLSDWAKLDGKDGFVIQGNWTRLGAKISGVGDFNGDGADEIVVLPALPDDGPGGEADNGTAHLIYGCASTPIATHRPPTTTASGTPPTTAVSMATTTTTTAAMTTSGAQIATAPSTAASTTVSGSITTMLRTNPGDTDGATTTTTATTTQQQQQHSSEGETEGTTMGATESPKDATNRDPPTGDNDIGSIVGGVIGSVVAVVLLVAFALGFWKFYTRDTTDLSGAADLSIPMTGRRTGVARATRKKRFLRR
jgi:hypothetical protein